MVAPKTSPTIHFPRATPPGLSKVAEAYRRLPKVYGSHRPCELWASNSLSDHDSTSLRLLKQPQRKVYSKFMEAYRRSMGAHGGLRKVDGVLNSLGV